ncbi:MAG: acyl-CoA synthetase [Actinobacteria bacterium]|nr:MAG: acyl-CoA synthetase [Actinomycetota bacterium]
MHSPENIGTLAGAWARSVAARPTDVFLIFEGPDGTTTQWTYAEFDGIVARVGAMLADAGVGPGSSVHLALTNCPTFVAAWLATNRLGAWIVPSDPMGKTPELADHIDRTSPVVGFCSAARSAIYRAAAKPDMTIVETDETDVEFTLFPAVDWSQWADPQPNDRAAVMFTSGTTGRPKGVEVTQANYAFAGKVMAEAAALQPEDRQLVVLPLFHANAQYYSFASAIGVGASVALMHTFSASGFLGQAARHRATCASLFAAPIRMILARGSQTPGVALRHCWFAQNIAADQYETISDWLGCRPRQLYGMTETIPAVLSDHAADPRPDSMGFVTSGCEVEVHDAAGELAPDGVVGELVIRGQRGVELFAGYLDDPSTTEASFEGEWFLSGDRARRESDGRFFFDGRRSDVLKVAGENVSTVEVEAVLSSHPMILEASVLGAPDDVRDEVPVAFVVPVESDQTPSVTELTQWCADRLSKAKVPRDITFLDELPRTSVGKIRKFILKEKVDV